MNQIIIGGMFEFDILNFVNNTRAHVEITVIEASLQV